MAHGNRTQPNIAKRVEINGADASRIRWHRVLNVNVTIEVRSLVSEAPKHFKLTMASCRAAFSGNRLLIVTFQSRQRCCHLPVPMLPGHHDSPLILRPGKTLVGTPMFRFSGVTSFTVASRLGERPCSRLE